jgi:protein-L-isoaspartate(D-aspartate) O-methyltransferase
MTADLHQRLVDDLAGRRCSMTQGCGRLSRPSAVSTFLPGVEPGRIYHDDAVTTQAGPGGMTTSSSSQPSIMASMLAQLDPRPGDRVLEIGAGTGYNAALLAHLVGPDGQVTTIIDIDPAITQAAQANLDRAGVGVVANQLAEVEVRTGDGWLGAADRGPFDRIQATVGCGTSPQPGLTNSPWPGRWSRRCGCAPACTPGPPSPARLAMSDCAAIA